MALLVKIDTKSVAIIKEYVDRVMREKSASARNDIGVLYAEVSGLLSLASNGKPIEATQAARIKQVVIQLAQNSGNAGNINAIFDESLAYNLAA